MIQEQKKIDILKSHDFKETYFGISQGNEAHIFGILRNNLYSDKQLAVIREYVTNANDSHIQAGIKEPVEITLPSYLDSNFRIRDFGAGLSEEDVANIFGKYGASTKRDTNEQVGFMGIGSKAAFCYTDSFSVVSRHNGEKCVYCCYIDESQLGKIAQISKESLPASERTGLEIVVPVKSNDASVFNSKLKNFCKFFLPTPKINGVVDKPDVEGNYASTSNRYLVPKDGSKYVIMGNIPYAINVYSLNGFNAQQQNFYSNPGICFFDLGSLDIAASRETLQFTTKTLEAMKTFADQELKLLKEWVANKYASCQTYYEAIMCYNGIYNDHNTYNLLARLGVDVATWKGRRLSQYISCKEVSGKVRQVHLISSGVVLKNVREFHLNPAYQYFINDTKKYISKAIEKNKKANAIAYVLDFEDSEAQAKFEKEFNGLNMILVSSLKEELSDKDYVPRSKQKILVFDPAKYSFKDMWVEDEIDYEEGGVYVPIYHYSADIKNNYIEGTYAPNEMKYLLDLLNKEANVKIDKLYGVRRAYVSKLNSKWIDINTLFEKYIEAIPDQTILEITSKHEWDHHSRPFNTIALLDIMSQKTFDVSKIQDPVVKEYYGLSRLRSNSNTSHSELQSMFKRLNLDVKKLAEAKKVSINVEKIVSDFHNKYKVLKHMTLSHWQYAELAPVVQDYMKVIEERDTINTKLKALMSANEETK